MYKIRYKATILHHVIISYFLNGHHHREDGPAYTWNDNYNNTFEEEWWLNGKLHRLDGPAVKHANGNKNWYINGKQYTEKEFGRCSK